MLPSSPQPPRRARSNCAASFADANTNCAAADRVAKRAKDIADKAEMLRAEAAHNVLRLKTNLDAAQRATVADHAKTISDTFRQGRPAIPAPPEANTAPLAPHRTHPDKPSPPPQNFQAPRALEAMRQERWHPTESRDAERLKDWLKRSKPDDVAAFLAPNFCWWACQARGHRAPHGRNWSGSLRGSKSLCPLQTRAHDK
jgi:hypothetical protein